MAKVIYKFPLKIDEANEIMVSEGYEILTVQTQNGNPFIWIIIETENRIDKCILEIVYTGNPMLQKFKKYIGTFQLLEGILDYHVFQIL